MKKSSTSIFGGIAGAAALNVLHQVVQQFDKDAPRVDLIGEEAIRKGLAKAGIKAPAGDQLFAVTMAADLVSNAAFYSLVGFAKKKYLPLAGVVSGLTAGIGALALTKPLGLHDAPITRTCKTKLLTVAWYTFGGLVAGLTIRALRSKG